MTIYRRAGHLRSYAGRIARGLIVRIYPQKVLVDSIHTWDFQRDYFIRQLGIEFAVDAGANIGQWGQRLRKVLPDAELLSFEPDLRCKQQLDLVIAGNHNWEVRFIGLGDANATKTLNLWDIEGGSSSFRNLNSVGEEFTGWLNDSMGKSDILVRRLDSEITHEILCNKPSILKIDVQGYESEVLKGCGNLLEDFILIEIELPLLELYSGSVSAGEIICYLESRGFTLVSLATERWAYPGAADCDALFVRSDKYQEIKSNL